MTTADATMPTLRGARALEEQGRYREALVVATAANRIAPETRLEKFLVRVRHEAFGKLAHPAPLVAPAPIQTDAPPPNEPLPALSPAELTPERLHAGLARHGCVWVKGLVPPARVERLVAGIDAALAGCDAFLAGAAPAETAPWFSPFKPVPSEDGYRIGGRGFMREAGGVWTAESPRMLFELTELIDDLGIGDLVTAHLGERPAFSANKCTLRRVPVDTSTDWHQDGAFLGQDIRSVNLWIALSHCGDVAPGMDIVPRRVDHVVPTGTEGAIFDWSIAPEVVAEAAEGTPILRPVFEPGDALLFDHLFIHRTAAEPTMAHERYAMETWMFAPSSYPKGQIPIIY